jgi:hypothetical protein
MRSRLGRTSLAALALATTLGILAIGTREALAADAAPATSCVDQCQFGQEQCHLCCRLAGDDFGVCVQPSNACVCGVG